MVLTMHRNSKYEVTVDSTLESFIAALSAADFEAEMRRLQSHKRASRSRSRSRSPAPAAAPTAPAAAKVDVDGDVSTEPAQGEAAQSDRVPDAPAVPAIDTPFSRLLKSAPLHVQLTFEELLTAVRSVSLLSCVAVVFVYSLLCAMKIMRCGLFILLLCSQLCYVSSVNSFMCEP